VDDTINAFRQTPPQKPVAPGHERASIYDVASYAFVTKVLQYVLDKSRERGSRQIGCNGTA